MNSLVPRPSITARVGNEDNPIHECSMRPQLYLQKQDGSNKRGNIATIFAFPFPSLDLPTKRVWLCVTTLSLTRALPAPVDQVLSDTVKETYSNTEKHGVLFTYIMHR